MIFRKDLEERIAKFLTHENKDYEILLEDLRNMGATQMECTKLILFRTNLSLREVNELVLYSKAWSDALDFNIRLQQEFTDAINYLEERNINTES